ncbi:MAG: alpha/beta fold hydrolase [Acidobacteriaceae bacterium]
MRSQDLTFTAAVTGISRALIARDRLLGRIGRTSTADPAYAKIARHVIPCGEFTLHAVFVAPRDAPARAAILICHGIGETVDHWAAAQAFLAERGVATLVFDYSGYGRSTGAIAWTRCEQNAVSAYEFLKALVAGVPISLLGFSMGSGIAAAIAARVQPVHLILCSAFTSFRDAACALGLPRFLASSLPRIWSAQESLRPFSCPILVVHCERDRAFPVRMGRELAATCGPNVEFVEVAKQAHNEAFYRPQSSFWDHILTRLAPHRNARPL